jgi:hypothetical protein
MKLYKSTVTIDNEEKVVVCANVKETGTETQASNYARLHHIHIYDRSYSMSGDLNALVENMKETFKHIDEDDLISVIWFASEDQGAVLFKGVRKSDDLATILDKNRSPQGCTCFSKPLQDANAIIDDLKDICPAFNLTFFTDGETVTYHSREEEEKRIFIEIAKMKGHLVALNTIGYGHYYNEDLLQRMSAESPFGKMYHSTNISEYADIFSHTYEIVREMVNESLEVFAPHAEILYLSNKAATLAANKLDIGMISRVKNQVFVIADGLGDFDINGETYNVDDITAAIPAPTMKNFLYALASEYYYIGRQEVAISILGNNLRDRFCVDVSLNAFTPDERAGVRKTLDTAIFKNPTRLQTGEAPVNYVPAADAPCVMELLNLLTMGDNYYMPISNKDYQRIGSKVTDGFSLFKRNEEESVRAPFNEFVFNANHLNMSIRFTIQGAVALNPKQAKAHNLPASIDTVMYRNQTIIKDGHLNMTSFVADVDAQTLNSIESVDETRNSIEVLGGMTNDMYGRPTQAIGTFIRVHLDRLPLINRAAVDDSVSGIDIIHSIISRQEDIKAQQKVTKYYRDLAFEASAHARKAAYSGQGIAYTADQIQVLQDHGLDKAGRYTGIDNAKSESTDSYESRILGMTLKGWSSLPSVKSVLEKVAHNAGVADGSVTGKVKALNQPSMAMVRAIDAIHAEGLDVVNKANFVTLEDRTKQLRAGLLTDAVLLNTAKLAKVLTGSWWEGLEVDNKGKYLYEAANPSLVTEERTLVITSGYKTINF